MKIRSFQKKPPRIEMLPLIDIVFLLLVVFIYAMLSMAVHKGLAVTLPDSATARADRQTVLAITVKADGAVFVNKRPVALDALTEELKRISPAQRETGVLLFADRNLAYQYLFKVLDRVKQAGLNRISLQAESEATP